MGYKVADLSSWGGELTDAEAEALKDYGIRLVVVNTWGQWTHQQAEMAVKHRLALEAYTYHYFTIDPTTRTEQGIAAMAGFPVARYWQDYEDEIEGYTTDEVVAHMRAAVAECYRQGVAAGIYTRRGWWEANTNGCTDFAHLPLWDAFYDGVPNFNYFQPYGGWTEPYMKQYTGTESVGGQTLDLSWREEEEPVVTLLVETQQRAILAMFCAAAVHEGRALAAFFEPLPSETWAQAWEFVGATTSPPQPELKITEVRRYGSYLSLQAPMVV